MTTPKDPQRIPRKPVVLAGLAGILAAIGAVYVIGVPGGNSPSGESCAGALASAAATKPLATGEVAAFLPAQKPLALAELGFKAPDGSPTTIDAFEGRTILVNLWATWCAPCRKEMPALDRLQAELGSDAFEVVAINLDRGGPDKPQAFLQEIGVSKLAYYSDETNRVFHDLRAKARATGLPTTILISPEGCEVGTMYGPAEWDSPEAKALIRASMAAAPTR
ncbi:redoxin family protein [Microvirga tunisiensis]|uniref:Redoxin family protein n=2 Tax=Pannonibacter tanglangensis TaxID=2750084 RepID=A0A7X5F5Q1_9HYPH|nr:MULTISPECIES: TlpA disulfide reductase family protein [unclassified Pannonibacter]NBN65542.1 redoxin family protein [Pannonibacter sp. XCT-34]NBN80231.1 redoxin family protein [Pannonibacter sp. XCT-53]